MNPVRNSSRCDSSTYSTVQGPESIEGLRAVSPAKRGLKGSKPKGILFLTG